LTGIVKNKYEMLQLHTTPLFLEHCNCTEITIFHLPVCWGSFVL
jgi:hypothetical protein